MNTPHTPSKTPTDSPADAPTDVPVSKPGDTEPKTPHDATVEASLLMPHERDESTDMTQDTPDPMIEQARQDIKNGLQDTSKGLEMNRAYKKLK